MRLFGTSILTDETVHSRQDENNMLRYVLLCLLVPGECVAAHERTRLNCLVPDARGRGKRCRLISTATLANPLPRADRPLYTISGDRQVVSIKDITNLPVESRCRLPAPLCLYQICPQVAAGSQLRSLRWLPPQGQSPCTSTKATGRKATIVQLSSNCRTLSIPQMERSAERSWPPRSLAVISIALHQEWLPSMLYRSQKPEDAAEGCKVGGRYLRAMKERGPFGSNGDIIKFKFGVDWNGK